MRALFLVLALLVTVTGSILWDHPAAAQEAGTLVVIGDGFENSRGQAGVNLFLKQEDMFDKPFRQAYAKIVDGGAEITFPNLPYGDYAMVLFHDKNKSGTVDHNFFRMPSEPVGFPNGFRAGLTTGRPTFKKLRIRFEVGSELFKITVD